MALGYWGLRNIVEAELRFTETGVAKMIKELGYYDRQKNPAGKGIDHHYELRTIQADSVVVDHTTGLIWLRSGSEEFMNFEDAQKYVQQLNQKKFAGYSDWRLPTLQEAMSLMESKKSEHELYIGPVFDKKQAWIWTADKQSTVAWCVSFNSGYCGFNYVDDSSFVRAVRSGQSII